jgi:hypothetical protein
MAWPVYTETFIRHAAWGSTGKWTVPAGHRAVITSITAMSYTTGGDVWAGVSDVPFWYAVLQAKSSAVVGCRVVAYSGQTVEGYVQASGQRVTISGYLFREGALARGRRPEDDVELVPGNELDAHAEQA